MKKNLLILLLLSMGVCSARRHQTVPADKIMAEANRLETYNDLSVDDLKNKSDEIFGHIQGLSRIIAGGGRAVSPKVRIEVRKKIEACRDMINQKVKASKILPTTGKE